jgi:hypothetical protein
MEQMNLIAHQTVETIRAAAADLFYTLGRAPTQREVREKLGSGSMATINKALRGWSAVPEDRAPVAENAITAYTKNAAERLIAQLYDELQGRFDAMAMGLDQHCRDRVKAAEDREHIAYTELDAALASAERHQLLHEAADSDLRMVRDQLARLGGECQAANDQLDKAREEIRLLTIELTKAKQLDLAVLGAHQAEPQPTKTKANSKRN